MATTKYFYVPLKFLFICRLVTALILSTFAILAAAISMVVLFIGTSFNLNIAILCMLAMLNNAVMTVLLAQLIVNLRRQNKQVQIVDELPTVSHFPSIDDSKKAIFI